MTRRGDKPEKARKPSFGRRIGENLRAVGQAGGDAVRNPRGIPRTAHGALRRWFRRVWEVRGGGLYAVGWALTFVILETRSVVGGFAGADSLLGFIEEELLEFLFRFFGDSIENLVMAFIWPVYLLQWRQPWGIVLLVAAFALFPVFVKPRVERWLFADDPETTEPGDS